MRRSRRSFPRKGAFQACKSIRAYVREPHMLSHVLGLVWSTKQPSCLLAAPALPPCPCRPPRLLAAPAFHPCPCMPPCLLASPALPLCPCRLPHPLAAPALRPCPCRPPHLLAAPANAVGSCHGGRFCVLAAPALPCIPLGPQIWHGAARLANHRGWPVQRQLWGLCITQRPALCIWGAVKRHGQDLDAQADKHDFWGAGGKESQHGIIGWLLSIHKECEENLKAHAVPYRR
eukprot:scaffold116675_cov19-Tisochrysis_lutea.AAC.1